MDFPVEVQPRSAQLVSQDSLVNYIKEFQSFAGLPQTGDLDEETVRMMNKPRCGVKDIVGKSASMRKKRYALQVCWFCVLLSLTRFNALTTGQGSRWKVKNLTYKISQYPSASKMSPRDVDEEIAKALDVWAEVTDLTFQQKRYGSVHIEVKFAEAQHGDGDPFDGVGGTLAHAFFPVYGGDAHFDKSEKWTMNTEVGTNLLQTAAHEFGHSLGLSHSDKSNALMAPFYRGFESKVRLDTDDVNAITSLYGTKTEKNKVPSTIHFPGDDDDGTDDGTNINIGELCVDPKFDTIAMTDDKETYVFKSNKYWKLSDTDVAPGYPRYIFQSWQGLPSNLDAAFTW